MNWGTLVLDIVWPPVWAVLWCGLVRLLRWRSRFDRIAWPWLNAAGADVVIDAVSAQWLCAAVSVVQVGIALAIWWWRKRRDRKRALDALGAKSRALRDALVRKARDAARPRPVLRPVPGGAR